MIARSPPSLSWVFSCKPLPEAEQRSLLMLAQAGDRRAADALLRSIAKYILKMAMKKSISIDVCEELFSAGLEGAAASISRFDHIKARALLPFLASYADGFMLDVLKAKKKRDGALTFPIEMPDVPTDEIDSPFVIASRGEKARQVQKSVKRALSGCPRVQKEIIKARYFSEIEEHSPRKIVSDRLGYSMAGVGYAEVKALARIKIALSEDLDLTEE